MKQRGAIALAGLAVVLSVLAIILGRYDARIAAKEQNEALKALAEAQERNTDAILLANGIDPKKLPRGGQPSTKSKKP